jgi:hypothetical protein
MFWILAGILTVIVIELSMIVVKDYEPKERGQNNKRHWIAIGILAIIAIGLFRHIFGEHHRSEKRRRYR